MLRVLGNPRQICAGVTRRDALIASGMGLLPGVMNSPGLAANTAARRAKSVICLLLFGGWSQLETFDVKPDSPVETRGPYRPIASSIPGLPVCEHLPLLAQRMDRMSLVRSVHSDDANHNTSLILTGHHATVGGTATRGINPGIPRDQPFFMSALQHFWEQHASVESHRLPNHLCVPNRLGLLEGYYRTGPYGGLLGSQYDPICTQFGKNGEPLFQPRGVNAESLSFTPAGATLEPGMTLDHLHRREDLLRQFDTQRRDILSSSGVRKYEHSQQRALDLMTSDDFRRALDLQTEPTELRSRYGWNLFGQSTLLARRLIEAGVPLVTAIWDCTKESQDIAGLSWDTHWDHFKACEGWLLPGLDQALSTLLDDMQSRGLLEETLIVCLSEMGRTPAINGRAGRDHWVGSYCALFAGAGVQPGAIYGKSDKIGAYVADNPVTPQDLLATVYWVCGIASDARIYDHLRRPQLIYGDGLPISHILS